MRRLLWSVLMLPGRALRVASALAMWAAIIGGALLALGIIRLP